MGRTMDLEARGYSGGEPGTEKAHTQAIGRLIHGGNFGSFNAVEEPSQTAMLPGNDE